MNKILILPLFFLTMCAPAPVTPPAGAFELEVEPWDWYKVYNAIKYLKQGEREKTMTDPSDSINKAVMEYQDERNDTTQSEELLQLSGD